MFFPTTSVFNFKLSFTSAYLQDILMSTGTMSFHSRSATGFRRF